MPIVTDVNKEKFQEMISNGKIVMVDFYADWCGPCKMIEKQMDELSVEYEDRIESCKINVDLNSDLAAQFDIRAIPAILIFKNGKMVAKHIGLRTKKDLKNDIEDVL